jgi:hypothetical protein
MDIKVAATTKAFSSLGGLLPLRKLYQQSKLDFTLSQHLPLKHGAKRRNLKKFEQLMFTFQAGADCLEDAEYLANDPAYVALFDQKNYTAKALGDFLRSFSHHHCLQLNHNLIEQAQKLRQRLPKEQRHSLTIDIDSTINRQYGKKMEGLGKAYNGVWGLDTIQAFDELGLQYWSEVREGGTYSSQGAETIIHEIFKRVPPAKKHHRHRLRADSAFCNSGVFNSCQVKDIGFVITMKANIYGPLIGNVKHWHTQNPTSKHRILFYDGRECEIGQTVYFPDPCHKPMRVVIIRAEKKNDQKAPFEHQDNYNYYAWVTSLGEHEISNEEVIKFYRKRGNAENFIKELKYGFDMKHYPCQKLTANKAYGTIAAYAYNFLRFLGLMHNSKKVPFAKTLRRLWVNLPCQIVHHARQLTFKYMNFHTKEVLKLLNQIKNLQFDFACMGPKQGGRSLTTT